MTAQTDLDGKLRAWLDLMPDEAPDHVVGAVLLAVEASPQPRATFRWPTWRPITMNRLFAAVGAIAVVAVVGVLLLTGQGQQATVGSSPSPVASAAAIASVAPSAAAAGSPSTAALGPVPSQLQHRWMGGGNGGISQPGAGTSLLIADGSLTMNEAAVDQSPGLTANAGLGAGGKLIVDSGGLEPRCQLADRGTYSWSISPSGRVLTVTGNDPCALRSQAMTGTWWLMGCKAANDDCLGFLDAGTYGSQFIDPLLADGANWRPRLGAITYTVPDGWANSQDWPNFFTLTPSASYAQEGPSGPPGDVRHEIFVFASPAANLQNAGCDDRPDPGVGRGVQALVDWLRNQPSLTTSKPVATTIDGKSGSMLDLSLRPGYTKACSGESLPSVGLLGPAGTTDNGWGFGIVKGERERLILLDLGSGHVVGIVMDDFPAAGAPSGFDALTSASMPIIESMHFQ